MRQVFKGDNYSREETIRGNTIFRKFEYIHTYFKNQSTPKVPEKKCFPINENNFQKDSEAFK